MKWKLNGRQQFIAGGDTQALPLFPSLSCLSSLDPHGEASYKCFTLQSKYFSKGYHNWTVSRNFQLGRCVYTLWILYMEIKTWAVYTLCTQICRCVLCKHTVAQHPVLFLFTLIDNIPAQTPVDIICWFMCPRCQVPVFAWNKKWDGGQHQEKKNKKTMQQQQLCTLWASVCLPTQALAT